MTLEDIVAQAKKVQGAGPATYVLIGGEAWKWHGVNPLERQVFHTSVSFVCQGYTRLRELGVPRSSIITILQLRDYLDGLTVASETEGIDSRLKIGYTFAHQSTLAAASRILAEGGPTYDGKDVNPFTVWSVLRGEASEKVPVVVNPDSRFIFFGIYSHGYYHSTFPKKKLGVEVALKVQEGGTVQVEITVEKVKKEEKEKGKEGEKEKETEEIPGKQEEDILVGSFEEPTIYHIDPVTNERVDPLTNEWYAFFPYAPDPPVPRLLDFVCVAGAEENDRPETLLYSTQLKAILFHLFSKRPNRPVLGLLNYCKSGGNLEFMRRRASREHYGANRWPLWLMSSSGACHNSLVGGLWQSFFENLPLLKKSKDKRCSFSEYYRRVVFNYHKDNSYELLNLIKSQAYPRFEVPESPDDTYHQDLSALLCAGRFGEPDFPALKKLQDGYHSGEKFGRPIFICFPKTDRQVNLASVVRECTSKIAAPEEVHGKMMGELDFSLFFPTPEEMSSTTPVPPPPPHRISPPLLTPIEKKATQEK